MQMRCPVTSTGLPLSVGNQDFTMTQQLVMLVVLIFVLVNFAVDIFYAWLDPRIRYS